MTGRKRKDEWRMRRTDMVREVRGYTRSAHVRRTKTGKVAHVREHRVRPHKQRYWVRLPVTSTYDAAREHEQIYWIAKRGLAGLREVRKVARRVLPHAPRGAARRRRPARSVVVTAGGEVYGQADARKLVDAGLLDVLEDRGRKGKTYVLYPRSKRKRLRDATLAFSAKMREVEGLRVAAANGWDLRALEEAVREARRNFSEEEWSRLRGLLVVAPPKDVFESTNPDNVGGCFDSVRRLVEINPELVEDRDEVIRADLVKTLTHELIHALRLAQGRSLLRLDRDREEAETEAETVERPREEIWRDVGDVGYYEYLPEVREAAENYDVVDPKRLATEDRRTLAFPFRRRIGPAAAKAVWRKWGRLHISKLTLPNVEGGEKRGSAEDVDTFWLVRGPRGERGVVHAYSPKGKLPDREFAEGLLRQGYRRVEKVVDGKVVRRYGG